jgi:ribA/ribD-fused uncharacterized protein
MSETDRLLVSISTIIADYRVGEIAAPTPDHVHRWISQFPPDVRLPIRLLDIEIKTSEALYQACRFPHLPAVQAMILEESSPMTAKMRSKPFRDQTRPGWDKIRVPIMKWCLRLKLIQNWESFSRLLLSTEELEIVESSNKDNFWGAIASDDGLLVGNNVLGRGAHP